MLNEYFDELNRADCDASSLLTPEAVVEQSRLFWLHPAVRELCAYVLDDDNTSDHHLLITAGPLAGSVFFLSHEGESRIVFDSATSFLKAVRQAGEQEMEISGLHPALSPTATNQASLGDFLQTAMQKNACTELVASLLPSLDLQDMALLQSGPHRSRRS